VGLALCRRDHSHQVDKTLSMDEPALRWREGLVAVRLRAEKRAHLIKDAAEASSRGKGFEPARGPVPLLNAPMVLFQMIIQVAVRPVDHPVSKDVPNGAWVGIVAIGGDAVGRHPRHHPGRPKERLGCHEAPEQCISDCRRKRETLPFPEHAYAPSGVVAT